MVHRPTSVGATYNVQKKSSMQPRRAAGYNSPAFMRAAKQCLVAAGRAYAVRTNAASPRTQLPHERRTDP